MTADPQASDQPRYGARGPRYRRAVALIALALGLAGFVISAAGLATQLLPRQFTAGQQQQIEDWEIAGRWQQLPAGRIFPASVGYQLSATVLQDATPLNLDARRIGIAPQSGCGAGVTTTAAAAVLRRERVPGGAARHLHGRHQELRHDRRRGRAAQRRGARTRPTRACPSRG